MIRLLNFILILNTLISPNLHAINHQLSDLQEFELPFPASLNNKTFGSDLAISGSLNAVAARAHDNQSTGSVYLYNEQKNWRLTAEIMSGEASDNFANRIILVNNKLIVGADHDDTQGFDSGAVYIYEHDQSAIPSQWKLTAKLTAPDAQKNAQFGHTIALVDNTLYIGAPKHNQGKVYLFNQNPATQTWAMTHSIAPDDPQALRFGSAIAKNKQTLIIGAPYTNAIDSQEKKRPRFAISKGDVFDPGIESGAIYVYENKAGAWQRTARIGASNRESGDHLGSQIAINNNTIVTSVNQKDVWDELRAGAVYAYKKTNNVWTEDVALIAEPAQFGGSFGTSLSLLGNQLLVGGNKTHSNGFNSGQIFLFTQDANNQWSLPQKKTNKSIKTHDQFGLSVALGSEHILAASKHGVYAFLKTPVQQQATVFYSDTNTLHLSEVAVEGMGVFSATLQLNQPLNSLILSVTANHLRPGVKSSTVTYSQKGKLTIPQLVVDNGHGERTFYTATLQQVSGGGTLQFKVSSFNPVTTPQ